MAECSIRPASSIVTGMQSSLIRTQKQQDVPAGEKGLAARLLDAQR
jgi:hypothetical protein